MQKTIFFILLIPFLMFSCSKRIITEENISYQKKEENRPKIDMTNVVFPNQLYLRQPFSRITSSSLKEIKYFLNNIFKSPKLLIVPSYSSLYNIFLDNTKERNIAINHNDQNKHSLNTISLIKEYIDYISQNKSDIEINIFTGLDRTDFKQLKKDAEKIGPVSVLFLDTYYIMHIYKTQKPYNIYFYNIDNLSKKTNDVQDAVHSRVASLIAEKEKINIIHSYNESGIINYYSNPNISFVNTITEYNNHTTILDHDKASSQLNTLFDTYYFDSKDIPLFYNYKEINNNTYCRYYGIANTIKINNFISSVFIGPDISSHLSTTVNKDSNHLRSLDFFYCNNKLIFSPALWFSPTITEDKWEKDFLSYTYLYKINAIYKYIELLNSKFSNNFLKQDQELKKLADLWRTDKDFNESLNLYIKIINKFPNQYNKLHHKFISILTNNQKDN